MKEVNAIVFNRNDGNIISVAKKCWSFVQHFLSIQLNHYSTSDLRNHVSIHTIWNISFWLICVIHEENRNSTTYWTASNWPSGQFHSTLPEKWLMLNDNRRKRLTMVYKLPQCISLDSLAYLNCMPCRKKGKKKQILAVIQ